MPKGNEMSTKLGTLTLDLVARVSSFTQGMRQASTTAEREMRRVESSVITVDSMLKKLAITAGATFSVAQVANYADSYTGMVNKLKLVTENQAQLSTAMSDTHKIAQDTASDWTGVVDVYTKFQKISDKLGLSQAEVARITETVTKSVGMSGASADESQRSLVQFSQALSLGVLKGQDLNSVMQQTPGLTDAIAKGMGVTSDKLKQMGTDGELSTQKIVEALQKVASSTDAEFAKTATTVASSFSYIKNEAIKIIGEFDNATGASLAFVEGMKAVSENMDIAVNIAGVMAAVYAGKVVGGYASSIAASAQQRIMLEAERTANIQLLGVQAQKARHNVALALTEVNLARAEYNNATSTTARTVANQRLITANIALGIAEKQATTAVGAYTTASILAIGPTTKLAAAKAMLAKAGTGLLGALGGPVGLAVMLATVAAGYLLTRDSTDESTKSLRENNESVDDAIKKYKELAVSKRNAQLVSEKDELKKLGDAYDDSSDKLVTAAYALSRNNDMTAEQSKLVNGLIAEYKKTGDIDAFSQKINGLNFISQTSKDRISTLGGSVRETGDQFRTQKSFVEQMAPAVKSVGDQAVKTATEVAGLSEEIKKLLNTNRESVLKNTSLNAMIGAGADPKLAEYYYEARKAQGILGTSKLLSDDIRKSVIARYNSETGLNKTLEERSKLEEKNKKLVEAQGAAMKVNALVAQNAAKAQADALESAKNLPKGILSAVNMVEAPLSNSAKSGAGARGPMQFISATADRYKVDVKSVESSYRGASNYLKDLLKMFDGDIENALRAYNWGEGNMQNYLKYGSGMKKENGKWQKGYFADKPMPRETRQYSGKVMGYMGGASGISFNEDYSYEDWFKEQEKFSIEREKREKEQASKQLDLTNIVATEKVRINSKLAQDIKNIEEANFPDAESKKLIAEYQRRADIDIQIAEAAQSDKLADYSDYAKSEEQLINQSYARRQRDLKLDIQFTADQYTEASLHLEKQRVQELQRARWHALEIQQSMHDAILGLSANADDIFAKATMSPQAYAGWSLENERSNAQAGLKNQRVGVERDIMTSEAYSTDDERYEALQKAHQEYRDGLAAIDVEYYQKQADLQNQTQAASMAGYGAMFGMMGSMLDAYGAKETSAYKTAFLMQKAFVFSSALLNAKGAVMAAWNDPSNTTIWSKMAAAAATVVQTNELMSAIQGVALSGMAHDGIDNIPKEGTWLLDKGERVVDSRTNGDLKDMIARQKSGGAGGDITIQVSVTDSGVSTSGANTQDQKQLGQMIGNAVRTVIRQEKRQGGLLSK